MQQIEIQFFWPLTEQIPLDLDFTDCPSPYYYLKAEGQPLSGPFTTGMTFVQPPQTWSTLSIDAETIQFSKLPMPWYRKIFFKLLGFKWKE